jgi:hypothetical protein
MRAAAALVLAAAAASPLQAQRIDSRRHGGSKPFTIAASILGAGAGMAAGSLLVPHRRIACGPGVVATCQQGPERVLAISVGAMLGAALGARQGRSFTGGDQRFSQSIGGAFLGVVAGGVLYEVLESEQDVPALICVSIPAGTLAALFGW